MQATEDWKDKRDQALVAGDRGLPDHGRFGDGDVRLAFGRHAATERLIPIRDAVRGAACGCFCPACSEKLIARQGESLAWHFAHASGAQCRDALSASVAFWLAQVVSDGGALKLPSWNFPWGHATVGLPKEPAPLRASSAVVLQDAPGHPFVVVCTTADGHQVRLIPACVQSPILPSQDECRQEGLPTVVVDLSVWLKEVWAADGDPAHLSLALLEGAPRRWVWSPRVDAALARHRQERLGGLSRALQSPSPRARVLDVPQPVLEWDVLRQAPVWEPLVGEGWLALAPRDWRMLFVWDMLVRPVLAEPRRALVHTTGFSGKDLGAWVRRRGLERVPYAVSQSLTPDDRLEWSRGHGTWVPAYTVVETWLRTAWVAGLLAAKPWKGNRGLTPCGPFDAALVGREMPFWRISDGFAQSVRRLNLP